MATYKIVRHYRDITKRNRAVRGLTGLTLEEVRAHCSDPQTDSKTCTTAAGKRRTLRFGDWFDGFAEEK